LEAEVQAIQNGLFATLQSNVEAFLSLRHDVRILKNWIGPWDSVMGAEQNIFHFYGAGADMASVLAIFTDIAMAPGKL
jgi:hypothetical protein